MAGNSVEFAVHGLKQLEDALFEIGNAASGAAIFAGLVAAGLPVQKEAKILAPQAKKPYYRYWKGGKKIGRARDGNQTFSPKERKLIQPGQLRKSISRKRLKNAAGEKGATIGISWRGNAFWGRFYELGTRKTPAQRYLQRAFEAKKDEALTIFKQKLAANIEKQRQKIAQRTAGLR